MGCDIHMFVELSGLGDDLRTRWKMVIHSAAAYGGRNYNVFAKLADVRNRGDIKPISEPRGLPKDLSPGVAVEASDCSDDCHSHSWFLLSELVEKVEWPEHCESFVAWAASLTNKDSPASLPRYPDRIRLVFWFDN